MAHILCILALLCFVSCVAENKETEHMFKDLQPEQDSFSWLYKLLEAQVRFFLISLQMVSVFLCTVNCVYVLPMIEMGPNVILRTHFVDLLKT